VHIFSHLQTRRSLSQTGRAYPDLAAQGSGFQVVVSGRTVSVGGTSASSPVCISMAHNLIKWTNHGRYQTVAGVFSLLNDFRLSQGKTSLGFINPLIYSTAAKGFNDITSGSNPGCGTAGSLTLITSSRLSF
jgi:tripeptidyl-peptidase-1